MQLIRYTSEKQAEWDAFVKGSKNGTFLFMRPYMDYHSDRFRDHSLMYYNDKSQLIAIMPANERDNILYSHQGLTYGGLVLSLKTKTIQVMDMFDMTISYLRERGFTEWQYKQMPTCYHRYPSEEDEYALWRHHAEITSCGVSSTMLLEKYTTFNSHIVNSRKRSYHGNLTRMGYVIERNASLCDFWPVLTQNLLISHNLAPVHSLDEIQRLQDKFPQNIECVVARNPQGEVEAGAVLYKDNAVVHTQYLSASIQGKQRKAMDYLILEIINRIIKEDRFKIFDFGISTEDHGNFLNEGLISQKEGFGGRGVVYKNYSLRIK